MDTTLHERTVECGIVVPIVEDIEQFWATF